MDSVLTYLVEDDFDVLAELKKTFKKYFNKTHVNLFRDSEQSLRTLLESLSTEKNGDIIISALAPYSYYNIIKQSGFVPVVLDINQDSGLPDIQVLSENINQNTSYIINTFSYHIKPITGDIKELGIPVIDILLSGPGVGVDSEALCLNADYTIISLENNNIITSLGGAVLLNNADNREIESIITDRPNLELSGINASFLLSLIHDIKHFFERKLPIIEVYKNSILKSGYYTFENGETNSYSYFPVILKKSLKDIQAYCKNSGLETLKGFSNSIVKKIPGIKCSNARSISSRTLLIPLSLTMKKDAIELISKILSTLP